MKYINRLAITGFIAAATHAAWLHDLTWTIIWSVMIIGNAACHWKSKQIDPSRKPL